MTVDRVKVIEDITNAEGYCFTDGCGEIPLDLSEQIAKSLGLDFVPSAFQATNTIAFY